MILDPYQEEGATWLANTPHPVLYLADQMRVGKTPQAAAAVGLLKARRTLVLCPGIVRLGWLTEFKQFCPDKGIAANAVVLYKSTDAEKIDENTRLVICSYDLLGSGPVFSALYARGMVFGFDVLILDEGHYLKETRSKRTQRVLGPRMTGDEGLAGLARRTWWLSGTPTPNDPSELFPFMRQAGLWPKSRSEFVDRYCIGYHDGFDFKVTGTRRQAELFAKLEPYMLRRLRTEVGGVELRIGNISIEPRDIDPSDPLVDRLAKMEPGYAKKLTKALKDGDMEALAGIKSIATIRRLIGIAKVSGVYEVVRNSLDADLNRKVVLFGIHRDPLRYLRGLLRPYGAVLVFGGMNAEKRDRLVNSFQVGSKRRVFLANIATAGLGINLSVADAVYIYEPSWSPAENEQALSRIINVRQPVVKEGYFIGMANSIDDAVARVFARKARDISGLFKAV